MTFLKRVSMALILSVSALAPAYADDPASAPIASFYATLTDTMKHGKELGAEGRAQKLTPAIDATFNLPLMVQFAVGPSWSTMSSSDHDALIAAFRRYTAADYAHNFESYNGQKFTIDPNVVVRGADHIVQSTLTPNNSDPVQLNYRMRQVGATWKIVDVFLAGYVSELSTRRSDYASTVASGGAPALVKKLNAASDSLLK